METHELDNVFRDKIVLCIDDFRRQGYNEGMLNYMLSNITKIASNLRSVYEHTRSDSQIEFDDWLKDELAKRLPGYNEEYQKDYIARVTTVTGTREGVSMLIRVGSYIRNMHLDQQYIDEVVHKLEEQTHEITADILETLEQYRILEEPADEYEIMVNTIKEWYNNQLVYTAQPVPTKSTTPKKVSTTSSSDSDVHKMNLQLTKALGVVTGMILNETSGMKSTGIEGKHKKFLNKLLMELNRSFNF